jgi:DNA-binding transcriptional ArsR family regulator
VKTTQSTQFVDETLWALAEPTRRAILSLVRHAALCPTQIASHFEVTRPAISQHIKVLRDAGLLVERREGTRRYYLARPQGLAPLRTFIERFREGKLADSRDAARAANGKPRKSRKAG